MKLIIPALRIRRTTRFLMSGTTTLTATRMTWVPVVAWFSHISEPGPNTTPRKILICLIWKLGLLTGLLGIVHMTPSKTRESVPH